MFYYYSACLHLGKTKDNFSTVGVIYLVLLIQDNNVPGGIKNATHNTFSNFRKSWLLKLKYPAFFGNG
jgi:hypothetical protein